MTTPNPRITLRRLIISSCIWFLAPCILVATENEKRTFSVPADAAEQSLKRFSAQSGVQLVFSPEVTDGVRTNAVNGEFTPLEAVNRMLAGTNLQVVANEKAGILTVARKASDPNAPRAALAKSSDRPSQNEKTEE